MGKQMTTLKEAQKDPKKLDKFIKEREKDTTQGDKDRFDKALKSIGGDYYVKLNDIVLIPVGLILNKSIYEGIKNERHT
jgi:hypothetical protein